MITLIKRTEASYDVILSNDNLVGEFIQDVDGFYYFWFNEGDYGAWSSNSLRLISDKLDEVNKEWVDDIENNLNNSI